MSDIENIKTKISEKFPEQGKWIIEDIDKDRFVNSLLFLLKHLQENEEDEEARKIYNFCKKLMEEKMGESREVLNKVLLDIYFPYLSEPKKLSQKSLKEVNYKVELKIKLVESIKTKIILSHLREKDYEGLEQNCLERDRKVTILKIIYYFTLSSALSELVK